jgi:hypothetical protein
MNFCRWMNQNITNNITLLILATSRKCSQITLKEILCKVALIYQEFTTCYSFKINLLMLILFISEVLQIHSHASKVVNRKTNILPICLNFVTKKLSLLGKLRE